MSVAADPAGAGLSLRDLPPNLFAVVMATGIVSAAAHGDGLFAVAYGLFWLNVGLYPVLWALLLTHVLRRPGLVLADLRDHARAPGFFAVVAGTCIVGAQAVTLGGAVVVGRVLGAAGLLLWFGLTYVLLPTLMEKRIKPSLEHGVNGGWLLAVVSTQAVCALGCVIADGAPAEARELLLFTALCFWLLGGMLYGWLIALIFYRCLFLPLPPRELTPAYWINMGAMAISTLAGVALVHEADRLALLAELLPFLKGVTLLFWATATWWIPMLLALGAWKHLRRRLPFTFAHGYWAAVFPMGMYTACTQALAGEFHLSFLEVIPHGFIWVALAAWAATFAGLVFHLAGRAAVTLRARPSRRNNRNLGEPSEPRP